MSSEFEVVADGLGFPEGPVAMADGSLLFVDIKNQTLSRLEEKGGVSIVAQIPGGPNGAAVGPDGAIYICNNGGVFTFGQFGDETVPISGPPPASYRGGSIQRVDLATGKLTTLYTECDGVSLRAPNDLAFDQTGGFWFTDTGFQDPDGMRFGAVFYATIDGARIRRAATLPTPNGIGLSPDGGALYVADMAFGRLWALQVEGPGRVAPGALPIMPGRVVQTLPAFQYLDSLKVEAGGRICVGTLFNGGVTIFTPDGATEHVPFAGLFTTNMCFGGRDMQDVWITASSTRKILKGRWPRPGLKLAFNA